MKRKVSLCMITLLILSNLSNISLVDAQENNVKEKTESISQLPSLISPNNNASGSTSIEDSAQKPPTIPESSSDSPLTTTTESSTKEIENSAESDFSSENKDKSSDFDNTDEEDSSNTTITPRMENVTVWGGVNGYYDSGVRTLYLTSGSLTNISDWGGIDKSNIKTISISSGIDLQVSDLTGFFQGMSSLENLWGFANLDTKKVTSMLELFAETPNLVSINDIEKWDVSQVTNMQMLFFRSGIKSLDLSSWDTSNVLTMMQMFQQTSRLESLNVSNWDTSKVNDMKLMFSLSNLKTLDLSSFSTESISNGTDPLRSMSGMFSETYLQHLTLGKNFKFFTDYLGSGASLELPYYNDGTPGINWRKADGKSKGYSPKDFMKNYGTGDLTEGEYVAEQLIFGDAVYEYDEQEHKLTINGGTITSVDDWGDIAKEEVKHIEFSGPVEVGTTSLARWFEGTTLLQTVIGMENLDTQNVTDMRFMFHGCQFLERISDLSNWNTANVTSMQYMFASVNVAAPNRLNLNLSRWNVNSVRSFSSMFSRSALDDLNLNGWEAENAQDLGNMFSEMANLKSLDISNFKASSRTTSKNMFGDTHLVSLKLGKDFRFLNSQEVLGVPYYENGKAGEKWRRKDGKSKGYTSEDFMKNYGTGDLTEGEYVAQQGIFGNALYEYDEQEHRLTITGGTITSVDDWDDIAKNEVKQIEFSGTVEVGTTSLARWFEGASQLQTVVGMGNLDTKNVTDMHGMFNRAISLTNLDLSNFDTSSVINMSEMFQTCSSLTVLDMSSFDTSKVINMNLMFGGMASISSLDLSNFDTSSVVNMKHMLLYVHMTKLVLGDKFKFVYDGTAATDPALAVPYLESGAAGKKWIREDGNSKAYVPVDFMKNYGTGDLTGGTYVTENKAPEAKAIIQIIQLGEELPQNPMDILKDIVDEDIDSLTAHYTKVPDTPKIGFYTAEMELIDEAGHKTLITIPVNVIDEDTVTSALTGFLPTAIHAEDFTVYSDEIEKYINDTQALKKFILERSNAFGWTLEDGRAPAITVEDGGVGWIEIDSKPGIYEITIISSETNSAENKISVTVIDSKEQLDVTVPISTEFLSLDTDKGEIISPKYHITNNSPKDIEVGVNNVEVTNNSDNISLLASSSPDPSAGKNAVKLKLDFETEGVSNGFDLFPGNLADGLVRLSPQEITNFQIGGKYYGDFEKDKQLDLKVVYSFKITSK